MDSKVETSAEPNASAKVRTLLDRAVAEQDDDPATARDIAIQARVVARAHEDRVGEAEALYRLASIAHYGEDPEEAFALALEASEIAHECEARLIEAWAVHLLGIVHYQASNFSEALEHGLRALEAYQATGLEIDAGNILNTVAAVYQSMGDNDRAIVTYEQALAAAEPFGRGDMVALILGNIARIRSVRAEYLPAVSMGRRAVDMARQHSPAIVTNLLADLAEAYMGLGDPARAVDCFVEAREVLDRSADQGNELPAAARLGVLVAEGRVALRRGALDEAVEVLETALDGAVRAKAKVYELEINDLLATAYKRSRRFEEALECREAHGTQYRQIYTSAADLRLRTLQVAHETAAARQEAEIFRLRSRTSSLDPTSTASPLVLPTNLTTSQLEVLEQLAVLVEFRDTDADDHTRRVGNLSAEIAHALGRPPDWCEQLRLAARLHDIGKVVVPDSVLQKTAPLTVEEYEQMKAHTAMGHRILAGNSSPVFQLAAEVAQTHHEWWDGNGYPLGLAGTSIALSGRIVAVSDVFDALCAQRPYKRPWGLEESARFIVSGRGEQFDPTVVDAFVSVMTARHPQLAGRLT